MAKRLTADAKAPHNAIAVCVALWAFTDNASSERSFSITLSARAAHKSETGVVRVGPTELHLAALWHARAGGYSWKHCQRRRRRGVVAVRRILRSVSRSALARDDRGVGRRDPSACAGHPDEVRSHGVEEPPLLPGSAAAC